MGTRRDDGPERETRQDALRRASFNGVDGGRDVDVGENPTSLHEDGQPESVECGVIHHVSAELRSSDGGVRQPAELVR